MAARLAAPFEHRRGHKELARDKHRDVFSDEQRRPFVEGARPVMFTPVDQDHHQAHLIVEEPPSPSAGRKRKAHTQTDRASPPRVGFKNLFQKIMDPAAHHAQPHGHSHNFAKKVLDKRVPGPRLCVTGQETVDCLEPVVLAPTTSRARNSRTKAFPSRSTTPAANVAAQTPQSTSMRTTTRDRTGRPTPAILAPGDPGYTYDPAALSILTAAQARGSALNSIVSQVSEQFSAAASVVASRENPTIAAILPTINSLFSDAASVLAGATATTSSPAPTSRTQASTSGSNTTARPTSVEPSTTSSNGIVRPTSDSGMSKPSYAERHKGAIIGGSIGGAAGLALLLLLAAALYRKKSKREPVTPSFDDGSGRAIDAPIMSERNQSSQGSFGTSPSAVGVAYSPAEPRSRWGRRSLMDVMTAVIPGRGRTPVYSGSSFGGGPEQQHQHEPERADMTDDDGHHPVSYISHQPSIYSDGTYQPGMPRPVTAEYGPDGSVLPAIRAVSPDRAGGGGGSAVGSYADPFRPHPMRTETEYISAEERLSSGEEEGELGFVDRDSPEQQAVNFGSSSGSSNHTAGNGSLTGAGAGARAGAGRTPTIGSQTSATRGNRGATASINSRSSTPSGAGHGQSIRKDGSWW